MADNTPSNRQAFPTSSRFQELFIEIVLKAGVVIVGYVSNIFVQDWFKSAAVAIALDYTLHQLRFSLQYAPMLEQMRASMDGDGSPLDDVRYLREHTVALNALTHIPDSWLFRKRMDEVVKQLKHELDNLAAGHFSMPMPNILDVSIDVCQKTKQSAFCTALEERWWEGTEGANVLRDANYDAARRLKKRGKFARLFIVGSFHGITPELFRSMKDNHNNGIEVLALTRDEAQKAISGVLLPGNKFEDVIDFGIWDRKYVMQIRGPVEQPVLYATQVQSEVERYLIIETLLRTRALRWDEIVQEVSRPVNGEGGGWSKASDVILRMGSPLGPHPTEVVQLIEAAQRTVPEEGGNIAILGLTHGLIEAAKLMQTTVRHLQLTVVDCRAFSSPNDWTFEHKNWLSWKPKSPFDAIVGDDVLCNLTPCQIGMFFECMAEALKPRGVLAMRSTLIWGREGPGPSEGEINERLRCLMNEVMSYPQMFGNREMLEGAVYEIAWPYMHSTGVYDKTTKMFDFSRWNKYLRSQSWPGVSSVDRFELQYSVHLSSIEYEALQKLATPYFAIERAENVHSIWESDEPYRSIPGAADISRHFKKHYRILHLKRKP